MANVTVTPLRDEAGEVQGFAKVMRDITERIRRRGGAPGPRGASALDPGDRAGRHDRHRRAGA